MLEPAVAPPQRFRDNRQVLAPVRPNAGIAADYRRRLEALILAMHGDIVQGLARAYGVEVPAIVRRDNRVLYVGDAIALDATPAAELQRVVAALVARWRERFDRAAARLADYFATAVQDRTDRTLAAILKRAGFAVRFRLTGTAADVLAATVAENVSLIKSIAAQHLTEVEGLVMRSVQLGRDLGGLTNQLAARYQITRRRAALIARDQNNKAFATITRVRHAELGIREARWVHSGGGKTPRPDHVAFSAGKDGGPYFDIQKGAFIGGQWVQPGELINCRCVARPVIAGLS